MGYVSFSLNSREQYHGTPDLENEIETLSSTASLSDPDQKRPKEPKAELDNIIKEKYLEEHQEQRKLVYRARWLAIREYCSCERTRRGRR